MGETSVDTEQLRLTADIQHSGIPTLWHRVLTNTFAAGHCLGRSEMHLEHVGADVHKHASIGAHVTCVVLNILDSLCAKVLAVARPVIFNASSCSMDQGCNSGNRHATEL